MRTENTYQHKTKNKRHNYISNTQISEMLFIFINESVVFVI